jgi:hypothetical protein
MNDPRQIKQLQAIGDLEEEVAVVYLRLTSGARLEHGEEDRIQGLKEEIHRLRRRNAELEDVADAGISVAAR